MKKSLKNIFIAGLIFIAAIGYYAVIFEPNNLKIERVDIKMKNLPESFEGVKFVQISDLHLKKIGEKQKKVLKIINEINPDYIFITGDIVDKQSGDLKEVDDFLKGLSENHKEKIYSVWGNHDHNNPQFAALKDLLGKNGIIILNNENRILTIKGESVYLLGVDDTYTGYSDLKKALKGVPPNGIKILLAHSPLIINNSYIDSMDVVFSGHTHGGQAVIPFYGPLYIGSGWGIKKEYLAGLFKIRNFQFYVNRGIGETGLPIRFNVSPEITLISFKNQTGL